MIIKSALVLVIATVVSGQGIRFTNPVDGMSFFGGDNAIFTWMTPCVAPYSSISATPTKTEVQLVTSTTSNLVLFLATVGYIDCSVASMNNSAWFVPAAYADPSKFFSLKIVVSPASYSGKFQILSAGSNPIPSTMTTTTSPLSTQPTNKVPGGNNTFNGSNGSLSTGAVVGIVVGVLAVLVVVAYIVWRKRTRESSSSEEKGGAGEGGGGLDMSEPVVEHKGHSENFVMGQKYEDLAQQGSPSLSQQQQQQQQQQQPNLNDQRTTMEHQRLKQQEEEELRLQIQRLQLRLEHSQGQHQQIRGSSTSITSTPYTPAPFKPPMASDPHGSQEKFRENLQLSSHPKPNVATTIQHR